MPARRIRLASLLSLLLLGLRATPATVASPKPGPVMHLAILGGGTTREAADSVRAAYLADTVLFRQIPSTPSIVLSDSVRGLNPGFFIAVLGQCPDPIKIDILVKMVNAQHPGAYRKAIPLRSGFAMPPCPLVQPATSPFDMRQARHLSLSRILPWQDTASSSVWKERFTTWDSVLIVRAPKPSFFRHEGIFTVRYDLAWIRKLPERATEPPVLAYVPEPAIFQSPVEPKGTPRCKETVRPYKLGPFDARNSVKRCTYPDGSTTFEESDWELSRIEIRTKRGKAMFRDFLLNWAQRTEFSLLAKHAIRSGTSTVEDYEIELGEKHVQLCTDHGTSCWELSEDGDEFVYRFEAGS